MPLDSYSPCPGGRDKKIHFCCPDMLKDLQQLETSLANGQLAAALAMVENLEKDHADCACLKAAKCLILRESGRFEEFFELAAAFRAAEPDNVRAISEYTIAETAKGEIDEALSALIDGIEKTEPGKISGPLLLPLMMIAAQLLEQGNIYTAVALAKLAQSFSPDSRETAALLGRIYGRKDIPLIEKELTFDAAAPEDFPFRDKYADAAVRLATGHWNEGKAILEELLPCAGQWPNLYRSLGLVKFWLGDTDGAREAMKQFAESEKVSFDDAVDAETAALMVRGPQSDDVPVVQVIRTVSDPDKAIEALLSSPRAVSMPFDPRQFGDAERPAPSHAFRLLDKPCAPADETPNLGNTAVLLGTFLFFGKQTDREARIEAQVFEPKKDALNAFLSETLGSVISSEEETSVLTKLPWLFQKLDPEFQFKEPAKISADAMESLYREYFESRFVEEWLSHPNPNLGGAAPKDFAESGKARTLAALIQTVGFQADPRFSEGLMKTLREKLGVPQPEPITAPEGDDTAVLTFFQQLPIWRWGRVDLSNVSAAAAGQLLQVVSIFSDDEAMTRLSERILSFPASKENAQARFLAYQVQIAKSETAGDPAKTLDLIHKGMEAAGEAGVSDAQLNLREAMLQLMTGRADEFRRLVSHVARDHRNEPEALAELQMMLMNLGLINPDGTPRAPSAPQAPGMTGMPGAPGFSAAPAPQNESKLWTPDSDTPSAGGGSKLWTPD